MGCRKLSYYQTDQLPELKAVRPKNELTLKSSAEKVRRRYVMGYKDKGNYCLNRDKNLPGSIQDEIISESLISDKGQKDFTYENTAIYFINTDDDINADQQSQLYYDKILSEKSWHYLPDESTQNIENNEAGAIILREILNDIVNK